MRDKSLAEKLVYDLEHNLVMGINLDKLTKRQINALINWVWHNTRTIRLANQVSLENAEGEVRQLLIVHTESKQTIPYSELVSLISNVYRQATLKGDDK